MLALRNNHRFAACIAVVASLFGLPACGGLSEGDYVFYRVAFEQASVGLGCYPNDSIPPSSKEDMTTFEFGETFILYVSTGDQAKLDTGALVLNGSIEDDPYKFSAETVDIDYPFDDVVVDSDQDGIADVNDPFVDADNDGLIDTDMMIDMEVDTDGDSLDDRTDDNFVDVNEDGDDDRFVEITTNTRLITRTNTDIQMTVDGSTLSGTIEENSVDTCEGTRCPPDTDTPCVRKAVFTGIEVEEADVYVENSSQAGP